MCFHRRRRSAEITLLVLGLALFIWGGCVNYALGKGYPGLLGLGELGNPAIHADDLATYLGLAALFVCFQRVFQTRFLPLRFRVLHLIFLRETVST